MNKKPVEDEKESTQKGQSLPKGVYFDRDEDSPTCGYWAGPNLYCTTSPADKTRCTLNEVLDGTGKNKHYKPMQVTQMQGYKVLLLSDLEVPIKRHSEIQDDEKVAETDRFKVGDRVEYVNDEMKTVKGEITECSLGDSPSVTVKGDDGSYTLNEKSEKDPEDKESTWNLDDLGDTLTLLATLKKGEIGWIRYAEHRSDGAEALTVDFCGGPQFNRASKKDKKTDWPERSDDDNELNYAEIKITGERLNNIQITQSSGLPTCNVCEEIMVATDIPKDWEGSCDVKAGTDCRFKPGNWSQHTKGEDP